MLSDLINDVRYALRGLRHAPAFAATVIATLDRSLIGRTVRLNSRPYTIVGVAPPGFAGPLVGMPTDVWVPAALQPEVDPPSAAVRRARGHSAIFDLRRSRGLSMVGRLPGDTSLEQVASRVEVIASRLEAVYPETNRGWRFRVTPLGEGRSPRVATHPILRQIGGTSKDVHEEPLPDWPCTNRSFPGSRHSRVSSRPAPPG